MTSSSSRSSSNKDGWIESIDPNSGRTFYANRYTRTTQWDPPAGWIATNDNNNDGTNATNNSNAKEEQPLPDGWEEMIDPKSGKSFYIDHSRQITTWERPGPVNDGVIVGAHQSSAIIPTNKQQQDHHQEDQQQWKWNQPALNNFTADSIMKLNQFGSHSHWSDTPPTNNNRKQGSNNTATTATATTTSYSTLLHQSSTTTAPPPPPRLNFTTPTIHDSLRTQCPSCHTNFSYTKRRHHCRLCGDIYCDACSNHRTVLPLLLGGSSSSSSEEYYANNNNRAVRVCNVCMEGVTRGNYFSLRRYLTCLELYDFDMDVMLLDEDEKKKGEGSLSSIINGSSNSGGGGGGGGGEQKITLDMVTASLSSLSTDLDDMLLEPLTCFREKMTIPAYTFVPAVARHLKQRQSGEYAVRVLATLLQLGNVVGDDSFGLAVLGHCVIGNMDNNEDDDGVVVVVENDEPIKSESTHSIVSLSDRGGKRLTNDVKSNYVEDVLKILEWNGNDIRTLSAQEQAVKIIYYITDPNFIVSALSMMESLQDDDDESDGSEQPVDVDAAVGEEYSGKMDGMIQIDLHRAFRSMLDHATSSSSPSLQRWSTACLRHLIAEDQRRACSVAYSSSKYESFTSQLVSTGGVMILCSLLNSDDGETRAHATSALEAIVIATREIGLVLNQSPPGRGRRLSRIGRGTDRDAEIVHAIISNLSGSGVPALDHLLTSADESVSMMGCSFILSLISPLLTDPRGSGRTLQQQYSNIGTQTALGFEEKDDGLSSYRNAAIALVVGDDVDQDGVSCLPSLIEIVRSGVEQTSWGGGGIKVRPLKVQVKAAECIAAIALAIGHIIGIPSDQSSYDPSNFRAKSALDVMEQERVFDVALQIISSNSHRSLDPSRDTSESRLREAAGLMILALSSCSSVSSFYLMSNGALSTLLTMANEPGMLSTPSSVRGKWASKGLCFLEGAGTLMLQAWTSNSECKNVETSTVSASMNLLLEALNAGAVQMASRLVKTKVTLKSHDLAYSQLRVKIAICFLISSMFGIAYNEDANNDVGATRLHSEIDADCAQFLATGGNDNGVRSDLVGAMLNLLNATLPYAHQFTKEDADEPLPMVELSEACILAAGSICGLADPIGVYAIAQSERNNDSGKYSHLRLDACAMACNILTARKPGQAALLPTVLVGAVGESLVVPTLRLCLAICRYGKVDLCGELSQSGVLVPVGDILQRALSSSDSCKFSLAAAIIRFCGKSVAIGSSASGTAETLKIAINTLSGVIATSDVGPHHSNEIFALKYESLVALEALCANDALQNSITTLVLPQLVSFLRQLDYSHSFTDEIDQEEVLLIALRTVQRVMEFSSCTQTMMNNGIVAVLTSIFEQRDELKSNLVLEVSMNIVQSLAQTDLECRYNLICSGILNLSLSILIEDKMKACTTLIGLQVVDILLLDLKPSTLSRFETSARNELVQRAIDIFCSQKTFTRKLIATIANQCDAYGEPFVVLLEEEGGADKAKEILFHIFALLLACGGDVGGTHFKEILMLTDVNGNNMSIATACSTLLDAFNDDETSSRAPVNPDDRSFYFDIQLPAVRSHLMEVLTITLKEAISSSGSKLAAEGLVKDLQLPRTCLVLCRSKKLAETAFRLFEDVVLSLPINFVGEMILFDRVALVTLFDLVTGQSNEVADVEYSKQTFTKLLGNLAKAGLLPNAVNELGVRSHAIAALSALIHGGEETIDEDEESVQRTCLETLAVIISSHGNEMTLTPVESRALALAIGKVLSSTILHRFFAQASLESTINDATVDFGLNRAAICQSAEAQTLCAMAHHTESLSVLSKIGGLEAIGLIAHEGEIKAIEAIQKACDTSPKLVVDAEAHLSIMDALISAENKSSTSTNSNLRDVVIKCLEIVTTLSVGNDTRDSIITVEQSSDCVRIASNAISASTELKSVGNPLCEASEDDVNDDESSDGDNSEKVSVSQEQSNHWKLLIDDDDPSLEKASFALLRSFTCSKQHRDMLMNDKKFSNILATAIRSSSRIEFLYDSLELLSSFTIHFCEPDPDLLHLFCEVIESQTRTLQLSRDRQEQSNLKQLLQVAFLGLQNLYFSACDQTRPIRVASELFVFLSDSFYSGPRSKRATVTKTDGMLFSALTSLFVLATGNETTRQEISTPRHVSSLIRFVMMTSGEEGMGCHIAFSNKDGEEYWLAAHTQCLQNLEYMLNETTQKYLGTSFAALIEECQPSSNSLKTCLEHISERANGGVSAVSARLLLTRLDSLS